MNYGVAKGYDYMHLQSATHVGQINKKGEPNIDSPKYTF